MSEIEITMKNQTKGPGALLAEARAIAHLSIEEVACKLYLTTTIIKAIEQDDFTKTPELTFVRGYLRSYARLVNLCADTVIDQFNRLGLVDESAAPKSAQPFLRGESSLFEKALPWLTAAIILFLLSLVFMWWRSQHSVLDTTTLTPVVTASTPTETQASTTMTWSNPLNKRIENAEK